MKFTERKEFTYDPELFKKRDAQTALRIYTEYVKRHSPRPYPKFREVDRSSQAIDHLWHEPIGPRQQFTRELDIPILNMFEKPKYRRSKSGTQYSRYDKFILAHNILEEFDYFPIQGDSIYWNGYIYEVTLVSLEPSCYWQQTNVWMGLVVEAVTAPLGDASPAANPAVLMPAQKAPVGDA